MVSSIGGAGYRCGDGLLFWSLNEHLGSRHPSQRTYDGHHPSGGHMSSTKRRLFVVLLGALAITGSSLVIAALSIPDLNWRMRVVAAKLTGRLPEIPIANLVAWLAPESPIYLERLAENPNAHSAISNMFTGAESVAQGKKLFAKHCSTCHGDDALGRAGPNLLKSVSANTDWSFFSTVKWGREGTSMLGQPLDDREIWQVHAFLRDRALEAAHSASVKAGAISRSFASASEIPASSQTSDLWLTYAGNHAGHRHTSLTKIDKETVRDLKLAWTAQLRPSDTPLEVSPIVSGGLIFVTQSQDGVVALDARTGEQVWEYRRPVPDKLPLCCGSPNRGAAILGDTLCFTTLDAHLIALDASTGRERWNVKVAEYRDGYSMTGAPLAVKDRVIVGVAGGEYGIRGFLAAFDAATGRLLWKFYTVPGPGEAGHDTWAGDSWRTGGAPPWHIGAYDPELDLVLWGVGNPSPPFSDANRKGDNLYSNSVVALDAASGRLRWHYQFSPNDQHDWDATQQPMLAEITWQGQSRKAVLWANRNGFYYAIDRRTGEFLFATPFVKQTWASGFDPMGRPIVLANSAPKPTGALVWPAVGGATNWWSPSYDSERRLVFVPYVEAASIYFKGDATVEKGTLHEGSSTQFAANQPAIAGVKAIDSSTGRIRWDAQLARGASEVLRVVGGVLSTASGVVFAGYRDEFLAFDADTGAVLWRVRLGARVSGAPISYAVQGQQFVAVAAGNSVFVFSR
jgi:alcohol dehydrogenase (cytochrome c)